MNNTFKEIISDNFIEISRNFKIGLYNKGYVYYDDLMNDAFISCNNALKDKKLSKKEAIKYYWTAYINKYKTYHSKINHYIPIEDNDIDVEYSSYDDSMDQIYDIIISSIRDKFGIKDAYIWELYICQGKSSKEIRNMGFNVDNFVYFTRKIKRYIINHIIPNNRKLRELINDLYQD